MDFSTWTDSPNTGSTPSAVESNKEKLIAAIEALTEAIRALAATKEPTL
jgi:hypothetical protein